MKTRLLTAIVILLLTGVLTQSSESGRVGSYTGRSTGGVCGCGDDQKCLQDCKSKVQIPLVVIGIVLGTLFVAIVTVVCCCNIKSCPCNQYQRLRRKYNDTEGESMPVEEFVSKRDNIIDSLKRSEKHNNYYYFQNGAKFNIHVTNISIVKEESTLLTTIKLVGNDNIGTWCAWGSILSKNNEIFMWYYQDYDNKWQARHMGKWGHLIHETTVVQANGAIRGKWFYKGFKGSNFSRPWILELGETTMTEEQLKKNGSQEFF